MSITLSGKHGGICVYILLTVIAVVSLPSANAGPTDVDPDIVIADFNAATYPPAG